jgi:hypothetical protein
MFNISRSVKCLGTFFAFAVYSAGEPSKAVTELITNGNFESGLSGWTRADQIGSDGTYFLVPNSGGVAPSSGFPYQLNPTGGNLFAMTDSQGPGSHSLTQAFTIPNPGTIVNYSFQMFANNWAGTDFNNGRNFDTPTLVQNAVVDIITGSDPFTTTNVIAILFGPGSDLPGVNPNPWKTYSGTVSLNPGTYQIRFAETDNVFIFNHGVDNVSISIGAEVPPSRRTPTLRHRPRRVGVACVAEEAEGSHRLIQFVDVAGKAPRVARGFCCRFEWSTGDFVF